MKKICCYCKEMKSAENFYKDKAKGDGLKPRCKTCEKLYINRLLRREYEKKYRQEKASKRRAILAQWYERNKEKHNTVQSKYRTTEQFKMLHRKHGATRRARERQAFVEVVDYRTLYENHKYCFYCHRPLQSFGLVEFDHYIPIAKGGKHETENIRISCMNCNRKKGANLALV